MKLPDFLSTHRQALAGLVLVTLLAVVGSFGHSYAAGSPAGPPGAIASAATLPTASAEPAIEIPAELVADVKAAGEALAADMRDQQQLQTTAQAIQAKYERDQALAENVRLRACHKLQLEPDDYTWSQEGDPARAVLRKKPPAVAAK